MSEKPSPKGDAGRAKNGRFTRGYAGGPGNPHQKKIQKLKAMVLACSTPEDVRAVMTAMRDAAIGGDVAAAHVWLDRVLGKQALEVNVQEEGSSTAFLVLARKFLQDHQ